MTPAEARAIAAPDSWPWPMSEEAKTWVHNCRVYEQLKRDTALTPEQQAEYDKFNSAEHERFMRGLG
jgi:hypothetical protein